MPRLPKLATIIGLCLLAGLSGCDVKAHPAPPVAKTYTVVTIANMKAIVTSPEISARLMNQCSRPAPDTKKISAYWTPDKPTLEVLESRLPAFMKQQNQGARDLSHYRRTYAGIVYNGRKVIYVDFARVEPGESGAADYAGGYCDGGDNFFGAEYDVASKAFSHLYFNGHA